MHVKSSLFTMCFLFTDVNKLDCFCLQQFFYRFLIFAGKVRRLGLLHSDVLSPNLKKCQGQML
jgi:hypothetical protein